MESISSDKLENIAKNTQELITVVNEGVQWVAQHLKDEDKADTNYKIKQYRRQLKKIKAVVTNKPTIALFGASQVGKSYMANNLLYNKENKLMVHNHQGTDNASNIQNEQEIDFLVYLNPEGGGKEATATVTRFTADQEDDPNKLPVKVRLFDAKDVVCILCDTYGSEFKDSNTLSNKEKIQAHIDFIKSLRSPTTQEILSDDDIYEIKEYLERYWDKQQYFLENLKEMGFWDFLADHIKYIAQANWVQVLEILWNHHSEISEVFSVILTCLSKLKFRKFVRVKFDAIVRSSGRSIVNVVTLLQYFFEESHTFEIQLENEQGLIDIGAGKLCLLAAEITLSVAKGTIENRDFIKNVDIIDFPGARSRFELSELSQENISNMLLRGKVAYLFNYYSTNFQTNTLAYCVKTVKTDVPQMPSLIENWIHYNLGTTPEERTHNLANLPVPPFFVIFTWWNTQLFAERATNEDPTERVAAQFSTLVSQEIMTDKKWPHQWVIKNGQVVKFQNYYLLRDFERSDGTFNQTNLIEYTENLYDGQVKSVLYETDPNPYFADEKQRKYHQAYFKKFKDFHQTSQGLFENPEKSFLEASVPGKDGSELIIQQLTPLSTNQVSVPIYINVLNKALAEAKEEFDKHYHSDQADEQITKANKEGAAIHRKMSIVFGENAYLFGSFIEHLTISENEILEFYHVLLRSEKTVKKKDYNKYILLRSYSKRLHLNKSYEENLTVLMEDYKEDSLEETEKYFKEKEGIDLHELFYGDLHDLQNNSVILAEEAKNHWIKNKLDINQFEFFIEQGLEKTQLQKLFDSMVTSFDKLHIRRLIAEEIREFVDVNKKIDRAEGMIAHITAGIINEFVTSMGWSYYPKVEKDKIRKTNQENKLDLRIPEEIEVFHSLDRVQEEGSTRMSVEKLVDYMDNLNENMSKKPIDHDTLQYVPMIKNYERWCELMKISLVANCNIPTYDIEANQQLGLILDKIKEYNFSL